MVWSDMIYIYENRIPRDHYSSTFAYQKPKILKVFSNLWKYLKHYMMPNLLLDQTGLIVLMSLIACMHLPETEQFVAVQLILLLIHMFIYSATITKHWPHDCHITRF